MFASSIVPHDNGLLRQLMGSQKAGSITGDRAHRGAPDPRYRLDFFRYRGYPEFLMILIEFRELVSIYL